MQNVMALIIWVIFDELPGEWKRKEWVCHVVPSPHGRRLE
jgi:hypothetical protein